MLSWLLKFFRRAASRPAPIPFEPRRPRIMIVARNHVQAYEYARHHLPYHEDWRYACCEDHLRGCTKIVVIKLPEWYIGKTATFIRLVESLKTYEKH